MRPELGSQLRAYAEQLDREAPPLEDLVALRLAARPPSGGRRPRWVPALVSGLVVLVLVGGAGVVARLLGPGTAPGEAIAGSIGSFGPPPPFQVTIERRIPPMEEPYELFPGASDPGLLERLSVPPPGPVPERVVVLRLSFDGDESWRIDFVSDSFPMYPQESVGSFWVTDGGRFAQHWAEPNIFTDAPDNPSSPLNLLTWDGTSIAPQFWAEQCSDPEILPDEEVAGRLARHARCRPWEIWVDRETGLMLRLRLEPGAGVGIPSTMTMFPGETLEVTEVAYRPAFPEETFSLVAPPGTEEPEPSSEPEFTRFVVGEEAPTWTAPLLSSGELDLAFLRGKPVALLFWASWCPPCVDDAAISEEDLDAPFAPFEAAYREHSDEVNFVSVAYMDDSEFVRGVVEDTGHPIPVVLLDPSPRPGETGEGWVVMSIPALIFLDEEGRFLGGHLGVLSATDVAAAIEALAAGEPLPGLFIPDSGEWP